MFDLFKIIKGIRVTKLISSIFLEDSYSIFVLSSYFIFTVLLGLFLLYANKTIPYILKLSRALIAAVKNLFTEHKVQKITEIYRLDKSIAIAGYAYDKKQDIFYSKMNAWQREMGYCRLYDEATAVMGMVIDCEPIFFEYDNRKWLIEFWKGQYDLTCGAEIGVYYTEKKDINIQGVFKGTFYDCVNNSNMLDMQFILKRNGKPLFLREGKHWWLTGFKLGEFAYPNDLTMEIKLTFLSHEMLTAFVDGLLRAGYSNNEITTNQKTISLIFDKPKTKQPVTRSTNLDEKLLEKTKKLCNTYKEITFGCDTMPEKAMEIRNSAPEIYSHIINIGKREQMFYKSDIIRNYIGGDLSQKTMKQLTEIFNNAKRITYDDSSKFVIMSDVHRGMGKKSDDFAKNKRLYLSTLKQYYKNHYTYIELGDGEELWENRSASKIIETYLDIYLLYKKFYKKDRLHFVYGNHDIVKRNEKYVKDNFYRYYDAESGRYKELLKGIKMNEALVLKRKDYKEKIFMLHGHQVDWHNDKLWFITRFLVRFLWKPLEHMGIHDPTRTAKVYKRKMDIERKIAKWVQKNNHMVISGHTHKAVFSNTNMLACFNDGSCVSDGGITAIEIQEGRISLVKWSYRIDDEGKRHLKKDILAGPEKIKKYFDKESKKQKTTA